MENHPKISCVLITTEPEYPAVILERLNLDEFFDEIIIVPDSGAVWNRYTAAKQAQNSQIYIQDDDCLVNYQVLFQHHKGGITNAITKEFKAKYEPMECTLVGWGCYFDKSTLDVFDRYIAKYGVDEHLLREADRIFTHLNRSIINTVIMPHEDFFQDDPNRMGVQPNHYISAGQALEKAKSL